MRHILPRITLCQVNGWIAMYNKSREICIREKYRPLRKSIFSRRNGKFDSRSDHKGHVYMYACMDVRKWYAGVCSMLVWSLGVELIYDSVRKYASTRAVGVRRSQPVIPIPLNRSLEVRGNRWASIARYIHIYRFCVAIRVKGLLHPLAHRPEVWSSESRVCERTQSRKSVRWNGRRTDRWRRREGGNGGERTKDTHDVKYREIKYPLRI